MTIRAKGPRRSTKFTLKRNGLMPWRVAEWQTELLLTEEFWMSNLSMTCSNLWVTVRRMFGGAGLFADGVMFGLVSGGQIYLKADATTATSFEREQCEPFEYATKNGKRTLTSYWRLPDRLYDDADELAQWARQALAAARQGATAKPKAGRGGRRRSAEAWESCC